MSRTFQWAGVLAVSVLLLSACTLPSNTDDTPDAPASKQATTAVAKVVVVCRKSDNIRMRRTTPIDKQKFTRTLKGCKRSAEAIRNAQAKKEQRALQKQREAIMRKREIAFVKMLKAAPKEARSIIVVAEFCKHPAESSGSYISDENRTGTALSSTFLSPLYDKYSGDSSIDLPSDLEDSYGEGGPRYGAHHKFCPAPPFAG